jgi:hypothetical protein
MERNQNRNAVFRSLVRDLPELVRGRSSHNQALDHVTVKEKNVFKYEEMGTTKGVTAYFGGGETAI